MELLSFPTEVIDQIIEQAVLSREFPRVMRLRLVNSQFKSHVDGAIRRLRLLSQYIAPPFYIGEHPPWAFEYHNEHKEWLSYVYSYFVYQVTRESSTTSVLGRIYRTARTICEQEGDVGSETISTCIRSLIRFISIQKLLSLLEEPADDLDHDLQAERDLYIASVYLGRKAYVEQVLTKYNPPPMATDFMSSSIFGNHHFAVADGGDVDMTRLFFPLTSDEYRCQDKISPNVLKYNIMGLNNGCGHRDVLDYTLDTLNFSLDASSTILPLYTHLLLCRAMRNAFCPQNFERIIALLGPDNSQVRRHFENPHILLGDCTATCRTEMVRYFLRKGVAPDPTERDGPPVNVHVLGGSHVQPLWFAVRRCHDTIARLLLEAGADPNWSPPPETVLSAAVMHNRFDMVKLLLDHGARVNDGRPAPIVLAVLKENVGIFRLLREHGATIDTPETGGWAMALAKSHELESMVQLLVDEGVGEDVVLHRVPEEDEQELMDRTWPAWASERIPRY